MPMLAAISAAATGAKCSISLAAGKVSMRVRSRVVPPITQRKAGLGDLKLRHMVVDQERLIVMVLRKAATSVTKVRALAASGL
jgi:hypothetical protein